MKNKLFYFLCGFCMMWLIAIVIIAKHPEPEGNIACGKCGACNDRISAFKKVKKEDSIIYE